MAWLSLIIAIVAEVIATSALKASNGFTQLWPSVVTVVGYCVSFYFLSLTMRHMPTGVIYAIWSGMGIVLISAVAWIFFKQRLDLPAIIGMQEQRKDRAGLLASLANLDPQPESVPINQLVKVEGVPLADAEDLDWTEFVRTIAVARIIMPHSYVRLSAGRKGMTEATQALCFMAGANSIFYGDVLLTTENPADDVDRVLMDKLDLQPLALASAE